MDYSRWHSKLFGGSRTTTDNYRDWIDYPRNCNYSSRTQLEEKNGIKKPLKKQFNLNETKFFLKFHLNFGYIFSNPVKANTPTKNITPRKTIQLQKRVEFTIPGVVSVRPFKEKTKLRTAQPTKKDKNNFNLWYV